MRAVLVLYFDLKQQADSRLTDDVQGVSYPPTVISHPEQKHDYACSDGTHQWMIEHLHRKAPFQRGDLFCDSLLGKVIDMIASAAH